MTESLLNMIPLDTCVPPWTATTLWPTLADASASWFDNAAQIFSAMKYSIQNRAGIDYAGKIEAGTSAIWAGHATKVDIRFPASSKMIYRPHSFEGQCFVAKRYSPFTMVTGPVRRMPWPP